MIAARTLYNKLIRTSKIAYARDYTLKLIGCFTTNPTEFWKMFKPRKANVTNTTLLVNDMFTYSPAAKCGFLG